MGWNSKDIYSYSWKGVPPVLINLNQQRERFKENFNICFVFLLPIFAIKYFIQRAPDFFDWRSGLFEFPIDSETLEQESSRIMQDGDEEKYLNLTPEERTQQIIAIQALIAEDHQTPDRQYDLLIKLGKLHSAGKDYKEAIYTYEKALEIKPDTSDTWYHLGNSLRNLGRNQEAIFAYDKAVEIKPNYHHAWNNRGYALQNLGRNQEAITSYNKALEINPNYYYAWSFRGIALDNLGCYEEAIDSYDQAVAIKPNDNYAWYFRGITLGNLGRYEEAIASYDKALEIKPDDHYAWNSRGIALGNLGRYEEAIASYDKALEIKPDDHYDWYNRGIALDDLGRHEEAIASYDKVLEINPDYHKVWKKRGRSLTKLGRYEDANINYNQAAEFLIDDGFFWYFRAYSLYYSGQYKEALASFEIAINSTINKFDNNYSWVTHYQRILINFTSDPSYLFWYGKGICLWKLHFYKEALASFKKVFFNSYLYQDCFSIFKAVFKAIYQKNFGLKEVKYALTDFLEKSGFKH
ncbi:tetratricopeptide repeat protein [Tolypothrix sp. PCC 7601]|uniref:tetratricopeptide repeat protein n=3 Tax=Tolypothrix TaxID=111782 RepID=UPI0005EAB34B|nr:tetratricopeptide repeat protein [Tolypothrix sp. PCC 7601]EKF01696.1 tetratricopeptide repeat protein [Tolypothrix sp. PCC 7601]